MHLQRRYSYRYPMVLAVEQFSFSKSEEYLSVFHRYISRSIDALYARIGSELQELSNESREQAWHLLDYGLKLTHGWEGVRNLLLALAPRMEREGFRHEWLPYLEGGVAFSQRVQDGGGEAQLSLYIGRLYRLRGDFAMARRWFESSAALFQEVGDRQGRAKALNQLGYVFRLQNQFGLAEQSVEEAFSLLEADDVERASGHWVLGSAAREQLKWVEAEQHNRAALAIWQANGDRQGAAWSLQNLGETLRSAGRYEEATGHFDQAIHLLGELHDFVNQAIARMSLGIARYELQEYEEARALYGLAETVFVQVNDQLHLGMVYSNTLLVERECSNWQAAERAGLRAINLWEVLGEMKYLVNMLDEMGVLYQKIGRYDEAIGAYERALDLINQLPSHPYLEMIRTSLLPHLAEARQSASA